MVWPQNLNEYADLLSEIYHIDNRANTDINVDRILQFLEITTDTFLLSYFNHIMFS